MVAGGASKHQQSYAHAASALDGIRRHELAASPSNYRLWYSHVSGANRHLSAALNDIIRRGAITQTELDDLSDQFLQQDWRNFDRFTADIQSQLDGVADALADGLKTSGAYGDALAAATGELTDTADAALLRRTVQTLVAATREAERESRNLGKRLDASMAEIGRLKESIQEIRAESRIDALTGLSNRKAFDERFGTLVATAAAQREPLSVIMLDIDHFKSFNDTFGHLTGDQVLKLVARCLKPDDETSALPARYGGEEFAVLLPNADLPLAMQTAEDIRRRVMEKELKKKSTGERLGRITVSLGVAGIRPGDNCETLMERADTCLYEAKRNGRNRAIADCELDAAAHAAAS